MGPLGTSSVMANVDRNWAVSTSRNTEVVSDATNVLALECAFRRKELLKTQTSALRFIPKALLENGLNWLMEGL